jgi:hypothetical protein
MLFTLFFMVMLTALVLGLGLVGITIVRKFIKPENEEGD